jgi:branched-chain amino acid transport system ATP-binding protein
MKRLQAQGLCKAFSGVQAVKNVSLEVGDREIVSLIGPNGAGKTTIFNLISGIYPVDVGQVTLSGQSITGKPQHLITRAGIGRTFQNIRLFKGLNVLENVMTAHDPLMNYSILHGMLCLPRRRRMDKENRDLAMRYLDMTGLKAYEKADPFSLPYGLQRKLEIARALATEPKVLLLDEPGAGLNPAEVCELIGLVRRLHETLDLSVLLIDHRMQLIMELSKYIYVLNFGTLLAQGTPAEIRENEEVNKAYMGEEGTVCS